MSIRPSLVRYATAAAAMSVSLVASGCSAVAGDDEVVRVYSARHYELEDAFDQFTDATGVEVEFLYGTDAELRERIEAEGEDTPADVYMTVDAGNLSLAAAEGIFQPLRSDVLTEAIPEQFRDVENRWYGLAQRARTIVYDARRVDSSELSTYEDLADPRWDGRLCLRGSTETYTQALVASLIARHGYDESKQIVAGWIDDAQVFSNDVDMMESIASGECEVGIANHYYLAQQLDEDPGFPVSLFWANQDTSGTHVNISGAGVTAHADDPVLAQRLLEWLATEGQDPFTSDNFEYPVNPAVEPVALVQEFGGFRADALHASQLGRYNAEAVQLMAEVGYE